VTPPALAWRARRHARRAEAGIIPGDRGIDDLVAGTRQVND
jgi:hypothetical protein